MQSRLAATVSRSARVFLSATHNKALPRRFATAASSTGRTADSAIHSGDPECEHPYATSPKLESTGVNQPLDPTTQQKRHNTAPLQDVSCAGLDGTPWPEDRESRQRERKEEEDDYKAYYKDHKASPLSEIEFADTRKPITRATDGTADSYVEGGGGGGGGGGEDVILWRPEQLDTAEDALRRASEIWKESAIRGDPDSPSSLW